MTDGVDGGNDDDQRCNEAENASWLETTRSTLTRLDVWESSWTNVRFVHVLTLCRSRTPALLTKLQDCGYETGVRSFAWRSTLTATTDLLVHLSRLEELRPAFRELEDDAREHQARYHGWTGQILRRY